MWPRNYLRKADEKEKRELRRLREAFLVCAEKGDLPGIAVISGMMEAIIGKMRMPFERVGNLKKRLDKNRKV